MIGYKKTVGVGTGQDVGIKTNSACIKLGKILKLESEKEQLSNYMILGFNSTFSLNCLSAIRIWAQV